MTLTFDEWPWKTIGHLFYVISSLVHHIGSIDQFKLELQSGNAKFGSKSAIFCPVWPWKLTDDLEKTIWHLFYATSSFEHNFMAIGQFNGVTVREHQIRVKIGDFFVPCDLEIWRVTLKNNREHFLSYIKLCASLCCYMWIQTGVTVRKRLSWVLTSVTLTFDLWPWPLAWTSLYYHHW